MLSLLVILYETPCMSSAFLSCPKGRLNISCVFCSCPKGWLNMSYAFLFCPKGRQYVLYTLVLYLCIQLICHILSCYFPYLSCLVTICPIIRVKKLGLLPRFLSIFWVKPVLGKGLCPGSWI